MKSKATTACEHGEELAEYLAKKRKKHNIEKQVTNCFPKDTEMQNGIYYHMMLGWERDYWRAVALKTDLPEI